MKKRRKMKRVQEVFLQDETGRIRCVQCLEPARLRHGKLVECCNPVPESKAPSFTPGLPLRIGL